MASGLGHFDQLGNPCIKLHLCGVVHDPPGIEFEGIVDTGFSGFIQLPIQHAFSLKLPLEGTANYTMANGASVSLTTALAQATFGGRSSTGVVTLATDSQEILIGMGFLRQFKLGLMVVLGHVVLLDEEEAEKMLKDRREKRASNFSGPNPSANTKTRQANRAES